MSPVSFRGSSFLDRIRDFILSHPKPLQWLGVERKVHFTEGKTMPLFSAESPDPFPALQGPPQLFVPLTLCGMLPELLDHETVSGVVLAQGEEKLLL